MEAATRSGNSAHSSGDLLAPPGAPSVPSPYQSQSLLVSAISRYSWLLLFLAVLLAAAGVAVGLKRKPVWTASSTLQVGQINPNSPGFYGFVQSATDLATTFSRQIDADGVLAIIQQKVGLTPTQSIEHLTATPIPDGAAFRVIATGASGEAAIRLANSAASAMISYKSQANSVNNATSLFRAYRHQATLLEKAKAQAQKVQNANATQLAVTGAANVSSPALMNAKASVDIAQARANALSAAYTQALQSQPTGNLVAPLASALVATSDRNHKIELFGFVGLAAGLLLGGTLAMLLEQRRSRAGLPL